MRIWNVEMVYCVDFIDFNGNVGGDIDLESVVNLLLWKKFGFFVEDWFGGNFWMCKL